MADYDVKVGVSAVGDPSGAKQVDQALQQVGATAQQVAQQTAAAQQAAIESLQKAVAEAKAEAASAKTEVESAKTQIAELKTALESQGGGGGLSVELNSLKGALDKLGPEKAKGAIAGLATAITGLASGDTSRGLSGLSAGLASLANVIPNPVVAGLAAGAVVALSEAWRSFGDTSAVSESLSVFGETVQKEHERLKALGDTKLKWENLKSSFATIKEEFEKAQSLANTLGDTILKVFNKNYDTTLNSLREQLAGVASDPSRSEELKKQISQKEQEKAIVENTLNLDRLTQQVKANVEIAQLEMQMMERKRSEAEAAVAEMEALRANVRGAGMSEDMLYPSAASEAMRTQEIHRLASRISTIEGALDRDGRRATSSLVGGLVGGATLPMSDDRRAEITAELEGLKKLKEGLLNFDPIAERAADAQKYLNETIIEDQSAMQQHLADTVAAAGEQAAAIGELNRSMEGVAPAIVEKAQQTAESLIALQVNSEAAIEQGVISRRTADEVVKEVSAGVQTVVAGMGETATAVSSQIETLSADLASKKETLAQLEAEIAASPPGAAEAALADKWALAEEIDRLTQEVADATARSAEQASSSQRSQEAAAEKVGDGLAYVGETVAAEGEATSAQVAESAEKMSAEPVRAALDDMGSAVADLRDMEAANGSSMAEDSRMYRLQMQQVLSDLRIGTSGYKEAAADFGSAGIEIARSVSSLTRIVSQLSAEVGLMRGDLGLLESQVGNMH